MTEDVTAKFRELTPKQQKFVEEYLCSFNVVEAYIKAGYSTNGKKATINKNAYQLLHSETIQNALADQIEYVKDNREYLIAKIEKFFTQQLDDPTVNIKDKIKSAELLAKMLGGFENNINVKSNDMNFNFNITSPLEEENEEE